MELTIAAQNHAIPNTASSGRMPAEGMLKNRVWFEVSKSEATYTKNRADTAHTNASDIAWPMSRSRAADMSCIIRLNPEIIAWLRAMNAWKGVEYNEKTRAQVPSTALSTDHTREDIECVEVVWLLYTARLSCKPKLDVVVFV